MKNAQEWLNEKHPLNQRRAITEINNSYGEELTGELINDLIVSVQNELGVANLNNLPLIPQGETLHTLLQRPRQEALEIIQNELNIERDHAQDMDNWYRRLINDELGNELLQIQYESRLKSNSIVKLESENEIIKQLAAMEIKDNLNLFSQIQAKKKELKQLKISVRSKLNEIQKIFLKNLLTAQEQLIYLKNATQQIRWPSERLLQIAKQNLSN